MALPRTEDFAGTVGDLTSGQGWFQQDAAHVQRDGAGKGTTAGQDAYVVDTQNSYADDQYSKMVVKTVVSGVAYCQVMTRGSTSDKTGYAFYTDGDTGAGHSGLQRWNAGVSTDLGSAAVTFADGDVMEMHSVGDDHLLYKNSILITTITDSSGSKISTGAAGFGGYASSSDPFWDDWEGGNHQAGGGGGDATVNATGFAVASALGTPTIQAGNTQSPNGFSLSLALGSPTVTTGGSVNISPVGFQMVFGLGVMDSPQVDINMLALGTTIAMALGVPSVSINSNPVNVNVTPTGLVATFALGTPTFIRSPNLVVNGFSMGLTLGTPTVTGTTSGPQSVVGDIGVLARRDILLS